MTLPDVPRFRELLRSALLVTAAWTAAALFLAAKDTFSIGFRGVEVVFREQAAAKGIFAAGWAVATPLLVEAARRLRLRRPHRLRNAIAMTLIAISCAVTLHVFEVAVRRGASWRSTLLHNRMATAVAMADTLLPIFFIAFMAQHLDDRAAIARRRRDEAAIGAELARVQLQQLRADLDPHFLFNALNAVSALIARNATEAEGMLRQLADLLQRSLDTHDRAEVELREEAGFVRQYLDVQKVRYGRRLSVRIEIAPEVERALVPPLILQPLVENAIVHGVGGDVVDTTVAVRAFVRGEQLCVEVRDSGHGFAPGTENGRGIGIANIRARLGLMYGERQSLTFRHEPEWFVASATLPLRTQEAA